MLRFDPNERIKWVELYNHPYFNSEVDDAMNPLDVNLKAN